MSPMHNPVYEKERWAMGRRTAFLAAILAVNGLLAAIAVAALAAVSGRFARFGVNDYSAMLQIYLTVAVTEFAMVVFIIPGYAGSAITAERERHSLWPLRAAGVGAWQAVTGKVGACLVLLLIILISSLPVFGMTFVYGGVSVAGLFRLLLTLLLGGLVSTSLSVLCSALCRRSVPAILLSYGASLLLYGGTFALHLLPELLRGASYGDRIGSAIAWHHYGLLANPAIPFYDVLSTQIGSRTAVFDLINAYGNYRQNWLTRHWLPASVCLQLLLALLLQALAALAVKRNAGPE